MEERNKAIFGCVFFLVLILFIGIGGYIYTFNNDKHKEINNENEIIEKNKKDKDKEYIYYVNEITVSEKLNIVYKNPIINLNNSLSDAIYNEISTENDKYYNEIKKISQTSNDTGKEIAFDTDDIYSATIRDYENFEYENYITLLITDSLYDCFSGVYDYPIIKSYIFDVEKNERISNIDILEKYGITMSEVKDKIRTKLQEDQTVEGDIEVIKIDETIENLSNDNTYGIYMDDTGNLFIKYVVKSNQINYNESMLIS